MSSLPLYLSIVSGQVDTRHRLGKVDGRYPHWVAPYDPGAERYSLIYYQTEGEPQPLPTDLLSDLRRWNAGACDDGVPR